MAQLYSVAVAARELGVLPSTVRAAIKRGRLRAKRYGHIWMIEGPSLAAYAATRRCAGRPGSRAEP